MTNTSTRHSRRERAFVLGGVAVAALLTPPFLALGAGADLVGAAWLAAILWTVPSSLALALRRGFRDGDWSAFRRHRLSDGREDRMDWAYGNQTFMGRWNGQYFDTSGYLHHFHSP